MSTTTALGYEDLPRLFERMSGDEKHDPSSLSTLDVLWVLYDRILENDDRFLLSKGHGPMAYYAVLAAKGYFPEEWLDDLARSTLRSATTRTAHGFRASRLRAAHSATACRSPSAPRSAAGASTAWSATASWTRGATGRRSTTPAAIGLERLTVAVVDNSTATHGWPGGIEARFLLEGWTAERVDGRDHDALERAFRAGGAGRPHAVVAEVRG